MPERLLGSFCGRIPRVHGDDDTETNEKNAKHEQQSGILCEPPSATVSVARAAIGVGPNQSEYKITMLAIPAIAMATATLF